MYLGIVFVRKLNLVLVFNLIFSYLVSATNNCGQIIVSDCKKYRDGYRVVFDVLFASANDSINYVTFQFGEGFIISNIGKDFNVRVKGNVYSVSLKDVNNNNKCFYPVDDSLCDKGCKIQIDFKCTRHNKNTGKFSLKVYLTEYSIESSGYSKGHIFEVTDVMHKIECVISEKKVDSQVVKTANVDNNSDISNRILFVENHESNDNNKNIWSKSINKNISNVEIDDNVNKNINANDIKKADINVVKNTSNITKADESVIDKDSNSNLSGITHINKKSLNVNISKNDIANNITDNKNSEQICHDFNVESNVNIEEKSEPSSLLKSTECLNKNKNLLTIVKNNKNIKICVDSDKEVIKRENIKKFDKLDKISNVMKIDGFIKKKVDKNFVNKVDKKVCKGGINDSDLKKNRSPVTQINDVRNKKSSLNIKNSFCATSCKKR